MQKFGALLLLVLLGTSAPLAAAAGDMSVATFLAKADRLKAKGILAMGSADIGLLKGEVQAAGKSYRDQIESDKAAKRTPHSCPPQKASMNSNELLTHFRSYPAASRSKISVRTAFFDLMKKRYPCR
jgi:hypothetical protein